MFIFVVQNCSAMGQEQDLSLYCQWCAEASLYWFAAVDCASLPKEVCTEVRLVVWNQQCDAYTHHRNQNAANW